MILRFLLNTILQYYPVSYCQLMELFYIISSLKYLLTTDIKIRVLRLFLTDSLCILGISYKFTKCICTLQIGALIWLCTENLSGNWYEFIQTISNKSRYGDMHKT